MALIPWRNRNRGLAQRGEREHPLETFRREMDDLFDRFGGGWLAPSEEYGPQRLWDFGVTEEDKEVIVRAELPGFEENELDVRLDGNVLTVRAEKQQGDGRQSYRSYYESVTLPPGIDADKAQASYRNGVLELHIPRAEGARPKRIPVQARQSALGQQEQAQPAGAGQQPAPAGRQSGTAATASANKR